MDYGYYLSMNQELFLRLRHELQSPLTVIQGFLRLMDQVETLDHDQKDLLKASQVSLDKIKKSLQEFYEPTPC